MNKQQAIEELKEVAYCFSELCFSCEKQKYERQHRTYILAEVEE